MTQQMKEKREALKTLSAQISEEVKKGIFPNINAGLIAAYSSEGTHTEFNSFNQWKEKGFQVKKGETAFLLWGKGKTINQGTAEEFNFYPLAFVFSNAQVEKITPKK